MMYKTIQLGILCTFFTVQAFAQQTSKKQVISVENEKDLDKVAAYFGQPTKAQPDTSETQKTLDALATTYDNAQKELDAIETEQTNLVDWWFDTPENRALERQQKKAIPRKE